MKFFMCGFQYAMCYYVSFLCVLIKSIFFFFLKQKTEYDMRISDWSSDVCSSDLSNRQHRVWPFIENFKVLLRNPIFLQHAHARLKDIGIPELGQLVLAHLRRLLLLCFACGLIEIVHSFRLFAVVAKDLRAVRPLLEALRQDGLAVMPALHPC